jgi:hypothetical protein
MRNAIVQLPEQRTVNEQRQVLRAAIRQLERAEIYVAAVDYMDLGDPDVNRALQKIRAELVGLRRHLGEQRTGIRP